MVEYLIPFCIIFAGLVALVIYVLAVVVRQLSNQLTRVNEKLLIMAGAKTGGPEVARALVAHSKLPKRDIGKNISKNPNPDKEKGGDSGLTLTIGAL